MGGTFEIPGTGITLNFADSGEDEQSFIEDDAFSFSSTAPTLSNSSVLKAVESLINLNSEFEIVHIVGTSGKTLWAALAEQGKEFLETYKNHAFSYVKAGNVEIRKALMNTLHQ